MAKVIFIQTFLEIPTRHYRKLQLWILVSGSELTLSYYCRTVTNKNLWFHSLYWLEFFQQDLHRQVFFLKNAFLFWNQLLYVQSIISVPPWRKISQFHSDFVSSWDSSYKIDGWLKSIKLSCTGWRDTNLVSAVAFDIS